MNDPGNLVFLAVFGAVVAYFVFRLFKFGGVKAAMFGARIERTVGEAEGSKGNLIKTIVRVHVLDGGPDKAVGLEFVAKGFASYRMVPITLSDSEARDLIRHLQSAVGEA
jgi:hypothetical protein